MMVQDSGVVTIKALYTSKQIIASSLLAADPDDEIKILFFSSKYHPKGCFPVRTALICNFAFVGLKHQKSTEKIIAKVLFSDTQYL